MAWAHGLVQISIHSAARAETLYHLCQQHRLWYFNPLRREGGDYGRGICGGCAADISIHSAARAETFPLSNHRRVDGYISIHSAARAETDVSITGIFFCWISIHSAARAETVCKGGATIDKGISIHSAARAETPSYCSIDSLYAISIHSAARAETLTPMVCPDNSAHFNPLRREGGDHIFHVIQRHDIPFQSTPPRGRRPFLRPFITCLTQISIHSAARAETYFQWLDFRSFRISIHSAARAETSLYIHGFTSPYISIHSAARAETQLWSHIYPSNSISIHSAARAETKPAEDFINPPEISIHSAARAETKELHKGVEVTQNFNPLRREGGDSKILAHYFPK